MKKDIYISDRTSKSDVLKELDKIFLKVDIENYQAFRNEVTSLANDLIDKSRKIYKDGTTVNISKSVDFKDLTIFFRVNFPERLTLLGRLKRILVR